MQCLAFAARRLLAEPVAVILAARQPYDHDELAGLPGLTVTGLGDADARTLLATAVGGRLDAEVRDRIVAENGGNPLALLQLPRGLGRAELAGGFWLPDPRPLASRIETSFLRQFRALPRETQRLLLTPAAEPTGDVTLLWRAAGLQGIPDDAAAAAEDVGLIELGGRVRFGHPWSAPRSTRWPPPVTGGQRTGHWPRRPIRTPMLTGGRGIWPTPRRGLMSRWPPNWNVRPAGRKRAGARPPRPRFSSGRRR